MLKERAVAAQQQGSAISSQSFQSFAEQAKKEGYTQFSHNLKPKNGGAPNISFIDPATGEAVLVNLSKALSESVNKGEMGLTDLFKQQIVDGANAAGEKRYYLARSAREVFSIDEVIEATKVASTKISLAEAIRKAGAGAVTA
jgi:hypothetical protein